MLGVLASYSITVKELKLFFSKLQGQEGQWVSQIHARVNYPSWSTGTFGEECGSNTLAAAFTHTPVDEDDSCESRLFTPHWAAVQSGTTSLTLGRREIMCGLNLAI